jgi:hypothetical protein
MNGLLVLLEGCKGGLYMPLPHWGWPVAGPSLAASLLFVLMMLGVDKQWQTLGSGQPYSISPKGSLSAMLQQCTLDGFSCPPGSPWTFPSLVTLFYCLAPAEGACLTSTDQTILQSARVSALRASGRTSLTDTGSSTLN